MFRPLPLRATFLGAALALGLPALSQAQGLMDNTNNASATGSPFAHAMPVTQGTAAKAPLHVGNSAGASRFSLASELETTQAGAPPPLVVGNAASAFGGPGTSRVRG